jgi:hypothetical protein
VAKCERPGEAITADFARQLASDLLKGADLAERADDEIIPALNAYSEARDAFEVD